MLLFTMVAWLKLRALLRLAETKMNNWEIQWFGRIRFEGEGLMVCDDVDIPEQTASSAHITSNASEFARWQIGRFSLRKGMTDKEVAEANEEMQHWRLWGHSHGDMTPTYSTTDEETLTELAGAVGGPFVGMVCKSNLWENSVYIASAVGIPQEIEEFFKPTCYAKLKSSAEPLVPDGEIAADVEALFERVIEKSASTGKEFSSGADAWPGRPWFEGKEPDEFTVFDTKLGNAYCWNCYGDTVKALEKYKAPGGGVVTVQVLACKECLDEEHACMCQTDVEREGHHAAEVVAGLYLG